MFQLRVTFVRNSHHIRHHQAGIKFLLIETQRVKDAHLQYPRLFYQHQDGVTLVKPHFAMVGLSWFRSFFRLLSDAIGGPGRGAIGADGRCACHN